MDVVATRATLASRVVALSRASELWLGDAAWRAEVVPALVVSTGQPISGVENALAAVFEALREPVLREFIESNTVLERLATHPKVVLHIAAGNVFTAWLHGAVITLLAGSHCLIKPSTVEPVFAPLWRKSLVRVSGELARSVEVVPWSRELLGRPELVAAYGSDDSLAVLRSYFPGRRFIDYGHKWSFGVVFGEALEPADWARWRDRVLSDSEAFNQAGCLSPQIIHLQSRVSDPYAQFNLPQNLLLKTFSSLAEVKELMTSESSTISCVGIAGRAGRIDEAAECFGNRTQIRYCALGEMQRPPLSWRNGGVSLVDELRALCIK